MRDHDIEEKVDDAIAGVFERVWYGLLDHGWSIADRLFKIASWTVLVGTLKAFSQETKTVNLEIIANTLLAVLFLGVVVTVMNVMIHFQDKASEKIPRQLSLDWRMVIMLLVNSGLILLGIFLILPAIISSVTQILDAVSAR